MIFGTELEHGIFFEEFLSTFFLVKIEEKFGNCELILHFLLEF